MEPLISELFDEYRKGNIDRRKFIRKLAVYVGSATVAYSILPVPDAIAITPDAHRFNGPELHTEMITYPGKSGEMIAFLARPEKNQKYPAVLVIHENKGLQPHIKDVTRRMAAEGFLAIAPDANSPLGGTPEDDVDKARNMMRELDGPSTEKDFVAAVKYLKTHPQSTGKVGCTGFCWGGSMTNKVAVAEPELDAAVPYYGSTPAPEDVPKIKASVMAHYAGNDARINSGIPAFKEALRKAGIDYKIFVYEGASHAFNNDSNSGRYHEEAAKLAWERTIAFFKEKLET